MDFFEKAHVSKKEGKTDDTLKKQFKQMLDGYKKNDNELIRNSENIYIEPSKGSIDDSSSVSGFSDLLFSQSSDDDNSNQELNNSDVTPSMSDINENVESSEIQKDANSTTSSVSSLASISDSKDNVESLSDASQSMDDDSTSSDLPDDISLLSSLLETVTEMDSEDSQTFDADGALAVMIQEKLEQKKNDVKKKTDKRKLSTEIENKYPKKNTADQIDSIVQFDVETSENEGSDRDNPAVTDNESENNSSLNSNISSPFVSLTATEMPNESLSQILGNYKHSTMKIVSTDIQAVEQSTNEHSLFSIEDMTVDDVEVLSPEYGNDLNDKEFPSTENCNNMETTNETITYDETETLETDRFNESEPTELLEEFVSPVKVYHTKDTYVLVLKHPAKLFIRGKVNVRALGGQVVAFGYNLRDQTCKVYAPNYNCAYCLITVENQNAYHGLFSKLTSIGLLVYEAEEIVASIGDNDVVMCLSPLKCRQMDFVEENFNIADLFSRTSKYIDNSLRIASETLGCSLYTTRPSKYFEDNPSWNQALTYGLRKQSKGIVCGGKGVGKSTFLRYYINKRLSQGPVLVIDLDPGQAEFTVPGSVSATIVNQPLLGPNFTHLRKPEKMLYMGMINTMDNPRRYAAAVCELITYCYNTERYRNMPWIVNTMGMCNALGLKFISLIILLTKPTYILQLESKAAKKRFECYLNSGMIRNMYNEQFRHDNLFRNVSNVEELDYGFFVCNTIDGSEQRLSIAPRDERYLNYLAYFGQLLTSRKETSLLGVTPYEVDIDQMYIGMNVRVNGELALKVINGKVVALCHRDNGGSRVFTLADKPLLCHGHGLVRAIDYVKGKLYIITPSTDLSQVNTLVYADWVPELRGPERCLPAGSVVPYRTVPAEQRRLMLAPRRRFNPLQLLKMSRSS